jgi:hypothetical protein
MGVTPEDTSGSFDELVFGESFVPSIIDDATELQQEILSQFKGGDPKYLEFTLEELDGYSRKNRDYVAGGSDYNGNFTRVSTILSLYPGLKLDDPRVVALIYAMKQLDQCICSLATNFEGEIEGLDDRLRDVYSYMKIIRVLNFRMGEQNA